jgi:hypothetical protein
VVLLPAIYEPSLFTHATALRQGEILTNLVQLTADATSLWEDAIGLSARVHPFAVILAQDCDLDQDFRVRGTGQASDKLLPSILFCEVAPAEEKLALFKQQGGKAGSKDFWNRVKTNKDERYHFLEKVAPVDDVRGEGLCELAIDFKRYFTISTDEVYARVRSGEAKRRCILLSPYLEHLCTRFTYYLSRVGLPEDHKSEPG